MLAGKMNGSWVESRRSIGFQQITEIQQLHTPLPLCGDLKSQFRGIGGQAESDRIPAPR